MGRWARYVLVLVGLLIICTDSGCLNKAPAFDAKTTWEYLTRQDFGEPIEAFGEPVYGSTVGQDAFFGFELPRERLGIAEEVFNKCGLSFDVEWSRGNDDESHRVALREIDQVPDWWHAKKVDLIFINRLSGGTRKGKPGSSGPYTVFWDPSAQLLLVKVFKF